MINHHPTSPARATSYLVPRINISRRKWKAARATSKKFRRVTSVKLGLPRPTEIKLPVSFGTLEDTGGRYRGAAHSCAAGHTTYDKYSHASTQFVFIQS